MYIKKPLEVSAIQLKICEKSPDDEKITLISLSKAPPEWMSEAFNCGDIRIMFNKNTAFLAVKTIRREEYAKPGDWLVNDEEGLRVVKDEFFKQNYNEVKI